MLSPEWFPRMVGETPAQVSYWTLGGPGECAIMMARHSIVLGALPPELRGRGYAGSATAATVERVYAEGRSIACLYADLRNPASNRCYTKIGFAPVCRSLHFHRNV